MMEAAEGHWWNVNGDHDAEVKEDHVQAAVDFQHDSAKHLWHHPVFLPCEFPMNSIKDQVRIVGLIGKEAGLQIIISNLSRTKVLGKKRKQ